MKSEGVAMIYDAMDNLHTPVKNGWTEKLDKLEKEIDRLFRAGKEWKEKEQLARDALAIACIEIESYSKLKCPTGFLTENIPDDCDNDCPVCLGNYFLGRAKTDRETEENNRIVRDEQEGREKMDRADIKRAIKEAL